MDISRREVIAGAAAAAGTALVPVISLARGPQRAAGVGAIASGPMMTSHLITSVIPGGPQGSFNGDVGEQILVGPNNLLVSQIGRWKVPGNTGTHTLKIVSSPSNTDLPGAVTTVNMAAGADNTFVYGTLASPVTLTGGLSYFLLSSETAAGDSFGSNATQISTQITVSNQGPVYAPGGTTFIPVGGGVYAFGPIDLVYDVGPIGPVIGSPFPFLGNKPTGGANFFFITISGAGALVNNSLPNVAQGTVNIDALYTGIGIADPELNGVTMEWMVDLAPMQPRALIQGPQIAGNLANFPRTWDTTTVADGAHCLWMKFIDATTVARTGSINPLLTAYRNRTGGTTVIIKNASAPSGAQSIPVQGGFYYTALPDFVAYPGTPQVTSPTQTYPVVHVPPSSSPAERSNANGNMYIGKPWRTVWDEYDNDQKFVTTTQGGVAVGYNSSRQGLSVDGAYIPELADCFKDGARGQNLLSSYTTFIAAPNVAPYNADGYIGITLQGSVIWAHFNGNVETLVGRRADTTKLPYTIGATTDETLLLSKTLTVGTEPSGADFGFLNDLCFDPRDINILYVVSVGDNAILRINMTTKVATIYAGVHGTAGYHDDPTATAALFSAPFSIIMSDGTTGISGPAGTMYVADFNNGCIRKIAPGSGIAAGAVTTLVGQFAGSPPPDATIWANKDTTYSPPGDVPFASAYINRPNTLRFLSNGDIALFELVTNTVRRIRLGTSVVSRVAYFSVGGAAQPDLAWGWMDVDDLGVCGPPDDIVVVRSGGGSAANRCSIDGTYNTINFLVSGAGIFPEGRQTINPTPGYTWTFCFSKTECRFIIGGFEIYSPNEFRSFVVGDPPDRTTAEYNLYLLGHSIWYLGTPLCFPFGSRPGFTSVHGPWGSHSLGSSVAPTVDNMAALYPTDGSFTAAAVGAGTLGAYLQAGGAGTTPRPELTGNDLRAVCYWIRATALSGFHTYPTPGPLNPDITPAVITSVSATKPTTTTLRVTWTTDKPTIGMAVAGSAFSAGTSTPYNLWSPMETGFGTTHDCTVDLVAAISPVHFSVLSKDIAGNSSYFPDGVV